MVRQAHHRFTRIFAVKTKTSSWQAQGLGPPAPVDIVAPEKLPFSGSA